MTELFVMQEVDTIKVNGMWYSQFSTGAVDYKTTVSSTEIEEVKALCVYPSTKGCDPEFERVCSQLMEDNGKTMPTCSEAGLQLYNWILELL